MNLIRQSSEYHSITAAIGLLVILSGCGQEELAPSQLAPVQGLSEDTELIEKLSTLNVLPFGRRELAFSLLVPKAWRPAPPAPSALATDPDLALVPLSVTMEPAGSACIEVYFTKLRVNLLLSDWVTEYLESNLLTVLHRQRVRIGERTAEDVVVQSQQRRRKYLARMTFFKEADRLFLVVGSARADDYARHVKVLGAAAVSFHLRVESADEFAEPMTGYVNPGPPWLEFRHPTSWVREEARSLPGGKVGVDLAMKSTGGTLAFIHIKGHQKSVEKSAIMVAMRLKSDFRNAGVRFEKKIRTGNLDPKQPAPLSKLEVWEASLDGAPAEVVTLVLANQKSFVALGLLVVPHDWNPMAWMTSWRVFQIVVDGVYESLHSQAR